MLVSTETVPANTTFNDAADDGVMVMSPLDRVGGLDMDGFRSGRSHRRRRSATVDFVVTTAAAVPSTTTQILNTVDIDGDGGLNDDASTATDVNAAPVLTATRGRRVPGQANVGAGRGRHLHRDHRGTPAAPAPATGVVFTDTPDTATTLVDGSVTTTQGTITTGNGGGPDTSVAVAVGTIAPGGSVTITFPVTVSNPFTGTHRRDLQPGCHRLD